MPAVSVLIKPVSGECNLFCDYCFYHDEMNNRKQKSFGVMTEKTLKNIIRKTLANAEYAASYAFQGGEPTLRGIDFFKKVVEYEKEFNVNRVKVQNSLQTNGTLLNDEWCEFLRENNFLVGVSVDGISMTHNKYRHTKDGKESYNRVLQGISILEKHKVDFNTLTVVNKDVAKHIKEIYYDYKKRNWNYQQYIVCMERLDTKSKKEKYAISAKEYGEFLINLFELWYEDWKLGAQPYIRQFENYLMILAGYYPESCDQRGVCSIQTLVEADGSVFPCDFYALDDYCLGNLNCNELSDIDKKRIDIKFIENSYQISGKCKSCRHYFLCRAGCHRNRKWQVDGYCNHFCDGYKMFFDYATEKLKEMIIESRKRYINSRK